MAESDSSDYSPLRPKNVTNVTIAMNDTPVGVEKYYHELRQRSKKEEPYLKPKRSSRISEKSSDPVKLSPSTKNDSLNKKGSNYSMTSKGSFGKKPSVPLRS